MTSSSRARRNVPPPTGSAAATPYARFIPREELSSFAAWSPGEVSGTPTPDRRAAAPSKPAESGDSAAEQLRQVRQSGYQDGYRDGLVALEGFKQGFAQQTTRQIGVLLQSIGAQLDALQGEMAQAVAEEALEALLLNARHITLRVHPDDHALVAEGAADIIAARGARLIADAAVTRGGCLVDSDIGSVDASVESRWRRATAKLGIDTGLPAATAPRRDDQDDGDA